MAQIQWQIVVDQITGFASELGAVAAQLQAVKDQCHTNIQQAADDQAIRQQMLGTKLTQEISDRETSFRDLDMKVDKVLQLLSSDRSARDVADHQLGKQVEQTIGEIEIERTTRVQEHAETLRSFQALQHSLNTETQRNAEHWNSHLDMLKRLEVRMEDRTNNEFIHQQRLTKLDADTDKLQQTVNSLGNALQSQHRSTQEDLERRGEELRKAVRDEVLGREHHLTTFARDLETNWHSLEARMQRTREEATEGQSALIERTRVLEQRMHEYESSLMNHVEAQTMKDQTLVQRASAAAATADSVDMGQRATEVMLHTTTVKIDDMLERIRVLEGDVAQKARPDFWKPQMESFQQTLRQQEQKLERLTKEVDHRFLRETVHCDTVKAQLQDSMKNCLEKIISPTKDVPKGRFIEVSNDEVTIPEVTKQAPNLALSEQTCSMASTPRVQPPPSSAVVTSSTIVPGGHASPWPSTRTSVRTSTPGFPTPGGPVLSRVVRCASPPPTPIVVRSMQSPRCGRSPA